MSKLLLFLLLIFAIYQLRRLSSQGKAQRPARGRQQPADKPVETMRECRLCGLLVPNSEGVEDEDGFFCCAEHARRYRGGQR